MSDAICNNPDHLRWIDELVAQTVFCNNHFGAPKYSGKKFARCPFCLPKPPIFKDAGKIKKTTSNKTPHRCPVCNGNGIVPNGFYDQTTGYWGSSSLAPEKCRTCDGTGIVWEEIKNE